MHLTADTSRDAYREHREAGRLGEQQRRIMLHFHGHGAEWTRSEISEGLGMRLSSVCGRVNELILLGYLAECSRRPCRVTGRSAHPVKVRPRQLALELAA